ncbi:MAG TPA: phosphatidate cytidylyltransferase [Dokdonella sp.]|uniref:phosphatidate cytidylyltransferase n=2 Tax=Dokdonella sp. TaxID=2291710 RepID=UPI002CF09539|nr:phosphatidate cytidylyltransferase [Dokdonella sp.]HOX71321.1 phosphatidate cytidylyltransferase [Dokdonella sp.]
MKQRILTGLILAPLAIAFILLSSTTVFAGVLVIVWAIAMWEWTRLIGMPLMATRILASAVGVAALAGLWLVRGQWLWWLAIVAGVLWWLIALSWMRHFSFAASPTARNRRIKLLAGAFVLLPAWAALIEIHGHPRLGATWTLFALLLVWAADSFAYFAGSRFGRNKLAPRISPGKTLEGVWGALIGTSLIAVGGGLWLGQRGVPLALLVALALLCVIYSILGDLFESLMKRQAGVKDSGALFPGHGGMLDRLDGVFAAIPAFAVGKFAIDLLFPA